MDETTTRPRRTPGAGSLYETPKGSGWWRGSYVVVDPVTRKRHRRYVSGHSRSEASKRLRAAIDASRGSIAAASSPTVAWWVDRWLDRKKGVRPSTMRSYRQVMRLHVLPTFGSWPLADLRPSDVERWTADLAASGLKPSTVALFRRILAKCLADAVKDRRLTWNAAQLADPPKVEGTTRRRALTAAEARHLLDVAKDAGPEGLAVILALGTGARIGELLALDWTDVDLDRARVHVKGTRSNAGVGPTKSERGVRTVALPPFVVEALEREPRRSGPVIATEDGRPFTPVRMGERWRVLRIRAGLDGLRFHDLRGTVATLALARGVPPKALADMLGHDPAVLLRTYAGPIEDGRETIAAAIGEALS